MEHDVATDEFDFLFRRHLLVKSLTAFPLGGEVATQLLHHLGQLRRMAQRFEQDIQLSHRVRI